MGIVDLQKKGAPMFQGLARGWELVRAFELCGAQELSLKDIDDMSGSTVAG